MKINITKEILKFLKKAITIAQKSSISGVLIKDNSIVANNGDLSISYTDSDNIDINEKIVMPIKALQYLSAFPVGKIVTMDVKDNMVTIKCGKSRTTIPLLSVDYPFSDTTEYSESITIDKETIEIIKNASISADINEKVAVCRCVRLKMSDGKPIVFSTDKYQATYAEIPSESMLDISFTVDNIPYIYCDELLTSDNEIKFSVSSDNRRCVVENGVYKAVFTLVYYGEFDIRNSINVAKDGAKKLTVLKSELYDVCKRASIIGEKERIIILDFKKDSLTITLNSDITKFEEEIQTTNSEFDDEGLKVCVRIDQLLKQLSNFTDVVTLYGKMNLTPVILEEKYQALLMPLRIS